MKELLIWLKKPRLIHRILRKLIKLFFFEQWILLIAHKREDGRLGWKDFTPILPPKSSFWADPFLWKKDGKHYLFYEDLPFDTERGFIACIVLDENMQVVDNISVLERPYHLSYPFLFEHDAQLYMLPETKENNNIELYRCTRFPDQWEFECVLIPNISAVDATLLHANDKWWLFANVEDESGSSWDSLHLFYADSPLSDEWKAHPKNPIIQNIQNSRPAGRIFLRDGDLIRPSQDCSVRYGYATNFNRIITLTERDFKEVHESTFKPQRFSKYYATHTWNEAGNLRVIDAQHWRGKR
ncbi:MAG: hypothetical protein HN390_03255 [Anaerolineae bacterium]|jgi:hypothetical protein|nr:hypothetical protein [Anaerolineae bacterium]MBT7188764.1 hypothetical protein [Anaerolineae bacterium]MBT7600573.1 hypothetical protein [Anaerolineae bacterium]MBT7988745.1 hypothetical protein [Anaerolineae bacterium]